MSADEIETRYGYLRKRYSHRTLVPFARRLDDDTLACWDTAYSQSTIFLIMDFSSKGLEELKKYNHFLDWLKDALQDMIDFE